MPISPLPDASLATADLLREEAFRLRKVLNGLEEENGKLASQLLAWQKWYKTGYKSQILFLEHQVNCMSNPPASKPALADGGMGSGNSSPSPSRNTSSVMLAPLVERPEVSAPPLPIRGANGELRAPGLGEMITFTDATLQKIQEQAEKSRKEVRGPLTKTLAAPKPPKGQMSEEQQMKWESFLARQTTECFGFASTESVEKKSTISDFRHKMNSTNLGFGGLQGLRTILRLRFGGSLIKGWKVGLSPHGRKRIGFQEFSTALSTTVGFTGNLKDLWLEICPSDRGTIGIEDLDRRSAAEVASLREVLIAKHGSIRTAWAEVFKSRESSFVSGLDLDGFTAACMVVGFSGNAKRAFRFLMRRDADHIDRVVVDDLDPEENTQESPKFKPQWKPARGEQAKAFKTSKNQPLGVKDKPMESIKNGNAESNVSQPVAAKDEPIESTENKNSKKEVDSLLQQYLHEEPVPAAPAVPREVMEAAAKEEDGIPIPQQEAAEQLGESSPEQHADAEFVNQATADQDVQPTEKPSKEVAEKPSGEINKNPPSRKKAKELLTENANNGMLVMYIQAVFSMRGEAASASATPEQSDSKVESKEEPPAILPAESESKGEPSAKSPEERESNEEPADGGDVTTSGDAAPTEVPPVSDSG